MRKHSIGKIKILLVLTAAVAISLCLVYVLKDNFRSPPQDKKEPGELSLLPAGETGTEGNFSTESVETADFMPVSALPGAALNGAEMSEERIRLDDSFSDDGFYYEPLSDNLRNYITGVTYPDQDGQAEITYEDLRYVHILHYDVEGAVAEGELICNKGIAQDLIEIFYELYCNAYRIEQVHLIDEYGGDDIASMEDNNTSCFNYRPVEGTATLSKHALGLAIDINPLYNPYVADNKDGGIRVSPEIAEAYADRTAAFPYKIDEADLCYRLFKEHGFTWGGNWKSLKDYQHFQKVLP